MRAASALALTLVLCAGCGPEKIPRVQNDTRAAERFRSFGLYYAGRSFNGLPMTGDGSRELSPYRPGSFVYFSYGQCKPVPGGEGGPTCNPPFAIVNYPICHFPEADGWTPRRTYSVGGAVAEVRYDYGDVFSDIAIDTGKTTVVVHGPDERRTRQLVARLRTVNGPVSSRDSFSPPAKVTPALRRELCPG